MLARPEAGHVAFDDHGTYRRGSPAGGVLICRQLQCRRHGTRFAIRAGAVEAGRAKEASSADKDEQRAGGFRLILS